MSIGGRVQEIRLDKVTHAHQNCKTWLTSPVYSFKSDAHHVQIFRKQRNRVLIWCKSSLDSTLHPTPCGDVITVMCALRARRAPWNWIQTCSTLVSQATPLCECTCSTCSISSSGRVRVAGGHPATKHQLAKTSGTKSVLCSKRLCNFNNFIARKLILAVAIPED